MDGSGRQRTRSDEDPRAPRRAGQARRKGDDGTKSDLIEFGGYESRWLDRVQSSRWLGAIRSAPWLTGRGTAGGPNRRAIAGVGVVCLVAGALIGYAAGHTSGHATRLVHHSRPDKIVAEPAILPAYESPAIEDNGGRCAVQVGNDLELGIVIVNLSNRQVTVSQVTPVFPLGGLRALSSGVGQCGARSSGSGGRPAFLALPPGGTAWVSTTVAVLVHCPRALPVGFQVTYNFGAGTTSSALLHSFPDLGQIPYSRCE